ncbi:MULTISPECIES: nucleotidyltransferase family protein [unclassified Agarivorans]|uniref:nucleotidyltransferase family protein n=1 Tax=unclassified Agarivorans TaxID=2636026 RepID=UPI0026E193EC|nr:MULTISPECIES: nucleotidyltransferase family protein [unclassified Agarivorans]MDO6687065.1 nucleotidyltransferase family protein [Agarivorans sp. 3_MG-2023]MDO6713523.1 nucleotidyltransferase family protein [Agarivorans sp. 2_MG-2023]
MQTIIELVKQDLLRIQALEHVRALTLPDCYIAAGFVRNLVWDHLHNKVVPTKLNDVDVIYFDSSETGPDKYLAYEKVLSSAMPSLNWQVRNQAIMHKRNGDPQYLNSLDAMRYWPEKETAVAIRLLDKHRFECIAAFGFDSLFRAQISYNPKRQRAVFEQRVNAKGWLTAWPNLQLIYE